MTTKIEPTIKCLSWEGESLVMSVHLAGRDECCVSALIWARLSPVLGRCVYRVAAQWIFRGSNDLTLVPP